LDSAASQYHNLVINAGSGQVDLQSVGATATKELDDLTITGGVVNVHGTVDLVAADADGNDGDLILNNSGTLTIDDGAVINVSGLFDQNGAKTVNVGEDITSGANMTFAGNVNLTQAVTLDSGDDVLFSGTVGGAKALTIDAVDAVTFGSTTNVTSVDVDHGGLLTITGAMNLGSTFVEGANDSGTVNLNANLTTNGSMDVYSGVSLSANNISLVSTGGAIDRDTGSSLEGGASQYHNLVMYAGPGQVDLQ